MLEIEKKFLVSGVPLFWPVSFEASRIAQVYLRPTDPSISSERVRMRMTGSRGQVTYTHTKKIRIEAGIHEEEEHVISESKYSELLYRLDPDMVQVLKLRYVFTWDNQLFEFDLFDTPFRGLSILEVELPSMDVEVRLPPFVNVQREVTTDPGFTNAALARKGCWP